MCHVVLATVQVLGVWRQHRLVHGDLKPSNIGVDGRGQLLLFDLESVVDIPEGEEEVILEHVLCTKQYSPPELLHRNAVNLGTDLFAVGVMLQDVLVRECVRAAIVQVVTIRVLCVRSRIVSVADCTSN